MALSHQKLSLGIFNLQMNCQCSRALIHAGNLFNKVTLEVLKKGNIKFLI